MINMSTEKSEQKFISNNLLNKKRDKSGTRHKAKRKKRIKKSQKKESNNLLFSNLLDDEKKIKIINQNIRHFFHINWDDDIYTKETKKISESIDGITYWHLINSSYFIEENIQEYVKVLNERYLQNKTKYDNVNETDSNYNMNDSSQINNDTQNNNSTNLTSFDIYNNNDNNIKKIINSNNNSSMNFRNKIESFKYFRSIMSYLDYDKKGTYFMNVFGYNSAKSNLNLIKEKLKNYINFFNQMNKNKINKLEEKAKIIEKEYNINNSNINNNFIKCINEDPLYTKNAKSYSINNKFLNYAFHREKNYLINQDKLYKNKNDENIYNINKEGEVEIDEEYSTKCFVCNNGDLNQYQYYYECEQCGIRVHPYCYGIKLKEIRGRWRCDKCKEMSAHKAINLECILCPIKGGALKKLNISKNPELYQSLIELRNNKKKYDEINSTLSIFDLNNDNNNNSNNNNKTDCVWIHLSCALWNKDVRFGNFDSKTNIYLDGQNIYNNYKDLCSVCCKDNCGPTLKCKIENCDFQCHPECGRLNNYYLEVEIIDRKLNYNIYCHNHHPNRLAKIINNNIRNCTDLVYNFGDSLNRIFHLYKTHYKKDFYKMENLNLIEIPIKINDNYSEDSEDENNNISEYNRSNNPIAICTIDYIGDNNTINNLPDDRYKKTLSIFGQPYYKIPEVQQNSVIEVENKNIEKNNESLSMDYLKNNDVNEFEYYENNSINKINKIPKKKIRSKLIDKNDSSYILLNENYHNKINISNYINLNESFINNNNLSRSHSSSSDISSNSSESSAINNVPMFQHFLSLEEEISKNKESFIIFLIGFLNDYFKDNRVIIIKGDGQYYVSEDDDENNILYDMNYDNLLSDIPFNKIQYNGLTINLIKKYITTIFPDENSFYELFINKIDSVLSKLKKNEKYKDREIVCRNMDQCIGSKHGIYKLSSIQQFKYQIINEKNITNLSNSFLCYFCSNNIQNI